MHLRFVRTLALVFAVGALTIAAAPSPMATVQQFLDGFNRGDSALLSDSCVPGTAVIDDFPPYRWTSCSAWYADYVSFSKKDGDTGGRVTLAKPAQVVVTGNLAYIVAPTTYVFKHHGKTVTQTGSLWTLILNKTAGRWRVTAWAWADGITK